MSSSSSSSYDLDGFPILRLDEITSLDTIILKDSEPAAKELLDSLIGQSNSNKLVTYLQRQLESTKKELARRAANDRVQALLLGAEDVFKQSYNDIKKVEKYTTLDEYIKDNSSSSNNRQVTSAPTSSSSNNNDTPQVNEIRSTSGQDNRQYNKFQPLPLPSELAAKSEQSYIPSRRKSNLLNEDQDQSIKKNNWVSNNPNNNDKQQQSNNDNDMNKEEFKSFKKQRSESIDIKPKIVEFNGMPSKASIAVLHDNFGSKFIVAATEKKKRIMPKKPSENISIEALKEKERLERRKQSMQRLMERREKRQALEYKAKINKQKKKMEKKANISRGSSTKSMNTTVIESDSSEESISGGEDEVVVDPQLVKNVESAIGTLPENLNHQEQNPILIVDDDDDDLNDTFIDDSTNGKSHIEKEVTSVIKNANVRDLSRDNLKIDAPATKEVEVADVKVKSPREIVEEEVTNVIKNANAKVLARNKLKIDVAATKVRGDADVKVKSPRDIVEEEVAKVIKNANAKVLARDKLKINVAATKVRGDADVKVKSPRDIVEEEVAKVIKNANAKVLARDNTKSRLLESEATNIVDAKLSRQSSKLSIGSNTNKDSDITINNNNSDGDDNEIDDNNDDKPIIESNGNDKYISGKDESINNTDRDNDSNDDDDDDDDEDYQKKLAAFYNSNNSIKRDSVDSNGESKKAPPPQPEDHAIDIKKKDEPSHIAPPPKQDDTIDENKTHETIHSAPPPQSEETIDEKSNETIIQSSPPPQPEYHAIDEKNIPNILLKHNETPVIVHNKPPPPDQKALAKKVARKFFADLSNSDEMIDPNNENGDLKIKKEASISNIKKTNNFDIENTNVISQSDVILKEMVANLVNMNAQTLMSTEKLVNSVCEIVTKIASPRVDNQLHNDVAEKNSAALSTIRKMKDKKSKKEKLFEDYWTEVIDEETGLIYWWNTQTNQTTLPGAPKPTQNIIDITDITDIIDINNKVEAFTENSNNNVTHLNTHDDLGHTSSSHITENIPVVSDQSTIEEDHWTEVIDEETGQSYWWNTETNETSKVGAPKPTQDNPFKTDKKKKDKKETKEQQQPPDHWTEVIDEETGQSYWWNTQTNETSKVGAPKPIDENIDTSDKVFSSTDTSNIPFNNAEDLPDVPVDGPDPWNEVVDEVTGKSYWWNTETNETTKVGAPKPIVDKPKKIELPDVPVDGSDPWNEVVDEKTGQSYWWNTETNETTKVGAPKPIVDKPKKIVGSADTSSIPIKNIEELQDIPVDESDPWTEVIDEETGQSYWWNTETNETTNVGEPKPERGRKSKRDIEKRKRRNGSGNRRSKSGERRPSDPMGGDENRRSVSAGIRRPSGELSDHATNGNNANIEQPPIISFKDNVYRCSLGPDELPGLRAWTLLSTDIQDSKDVKWTVDISTYFDTTKVDPLIIQLNERRQLARRSVSYGLVQLVKDCESILTGKEPISHSSQFIALWEKRLEEFDEKVFELNEMEEKELFRTVAVCGNCHAVCRKVEHLLKCKFTIGNSECAATPRSNFRPARESPIARSRKTSIDETHINRIGNSRDMEEDDDNKEDSSEDDEEALLPSYNNPVSNIKLSLPPGSIDKINLNSKNQESTPGDMALIAPPASARALLRTPPLEAKQRWVEENKLREVDKLREQMVKKEIDVKNTTVRSANSNQDNTTSSNVMVDLNMAVKRSHIEVIPDPESVQLSKLRMERVIEDQITNITITPAKLTEIYPHIGAIFPAIGGTAPSAATARTLIECMESQSKLYEEWIEIMSDYATVFSQDRGVKENKEDEMPNSSSAVVYNGGTRSLHYRVKSPRPEVYNIVTDVLNNLLKGWEELPAGLGLGVSWNLLWTWSKPRLNMTHLLSWQKVNHFQDSKQLTRKDLLKKNLQRFTDMTGKIAEAFEIMPQTFLLPHEYTQFVKCFTDIENKREELGVQNYWIMKPVGMSRGRGITLVRDVVSLTYSQTSVVQMYVERPLTLGGYKFDLRLFVCVTSFKPLEAFVYKEGFARVSTHTYSTDPSQMGNKFIHLTNSSIQKQNTAGPTKDNPLMDSEGPGGGSKIPLHGHNGLWERLEHSGINVEVLWRNICLVILKSLVVVDEKIANQPCGFELFGYDVLIDEQLRPWLIEVNASPSLARENQLDIRIKNSMIRDTISLVEPAPYDRAAVARILKRRLIDISKNRFTSSKNDPDLENDLKEIFGDYTPRRVGENPHNMGDYQRLCPNTKIYTHIMRLKGRIIKEK